ncbi:type II secretion system protein [Ferriphaselus sp. R-1]|uniref:type II secretion system protein n=1 Tax=Ferriphaselus sp. R-1 TaxID=1485544 RepID=UPI0005558FA3|nr:type II secretion system protein [Ferriphaselus sp. R-1]
MRRNGFTLIELVVSVAIVALLASIVIPVEELLVKRTKEQELRQSLREIRSALDAYKQAVDDKRVDPTLSRSGYPTALAVLVDGVQDRGNVDKQGKLHFLRRLPRDPFAENTLSAEESWGKRSYASSADDPREGEDVFDVYSKAAGTGLNGIPYRKW